MENIILAQLTKYFEKNNLLNESQYAYRKNSSTEQALVNVTQQIYKSIDKGKISLIVLLDLSKAFDSVIHDLLLNKLVKLNIDSCGVREARPLNGGKKKMDKAIRNYIYW